MSCAFTFSLRLLFIILVIVSIQCVRSPNNSDGSSSTWRRSLLIGVETYGLANRLRALADWYSIAQMSGRRLLVSWKATAECNSTFEDLFESYAKNMHILTFSIPSNQTGKAIIQEIARQNNYSTAFFDIDNRIVLSDVSTVFSSVNILYTFHIGARVLGGVPCAYYLAMKSSFLANLVAVRDVREVVQQLQQRYFEGYSVVGVHVREHDPIFDWAVVPPMQFLGNHRPHATANVGGNQRLQTHNRSENESQLQALHFGEGATVSDFARVMKGIGDHFNQLGRSNVRFFIASNSATAKEMLTDMFLNTSFALNLQYSRNSVSGMQLALVEWLLLSHCNLIINSYGSTFAAEAALIGNNNNRAVPLVGIVNGNLVFHTNTNLPYCGIMLYLAVYSRAGTKGRYREGTNDRRVVDSVAIVLEKCDLLENWGFIDPVYCVQVA